MTSTHSSFLFRLILCIIAIHFFSCASRYKQFYKDDFHSQDRIYQNETLGFALVYKPTWKVYTDPRTMDRNRRTAARLLHEQGAEMLFTGETVDKSQGTRAIAENLNRTNEEYLAGVRKANADGIAEEYGTAAFMAGDIMALKWEYRYGKFRYAEFLFKAGTHNVRVAFWTVPERYNEFLPVYEDIMATLSTRVGM